MSPESSGIAIRTLTLSEPEFQEIRTLVYRQFGINLTEEKKTLIVGRLQKLVFDLGYKTFTEYFEYLKQDRSGQSLLDLVNRITTNHTFFYREKEHFEYFVSQVLPEMTRKRTHERNLNLRIWSAGCSSGEEPYTLAMLMLDYFGQNYRAWDAGVLATDVSAKVIAIAQKGEYPSDHLNELPPKFKQKNFLQTPSGSWRINDEIKKEITFRHFNLMNQVFPFKKPFDVIFCRNVMIYFDQPTRDALVRRFYQHTTPGGYLFIGHSESLTHLKTDYQYIMPAVYRRKENAT